MTDLFSAKVILALMQFVSVLTPPESGRLLRQDIDLGTGENPVAELDAIGFAGVEADVDPVRSSACGHSIG